MPQPLEAFSEDEMRSELRALTLEVQACLALSRATLRALATLSPDMSCAAETAVEDEAHRARSPRVAEFLDGVRNQIARAPEEAKMASALEHALISAADALT